MTNTEKQTEALRLADCLERDVRLDWVIEHRGIVFHLGSEYCVTFPFDPDAGTTPYRDSPREAIDTAMSLQKGSGQ